MAQEPPGPHPEHTIDWDDSSARLRSMIRAHVGKIPPEELDAWTHEALIKFIRKLRKDGQVRDRIALLSVIADSTAKDYIRWVQRRRARFVDWEDQFEAIAEPPSQVSDWEEGHQLLWFLLLEYF